MDVEVSGSISSIEDALILLDRAKEQNDGIVHEGEGLAGFPGSEDGAFIDLVLGLAEDADGRPAPVGIRATSVAHDDSLGLAGKLGKLIEVDALDEESLVEGVDSGGRTVISTGETFKEKLPKEFVSGGDAVRRGRRAEAETFLNRGDEESGVVFGVVNGGDEGHGLSRKVVLLVDVRELVGELAPPDDFAVCGIMSWEVVSDQILEGLPRVDRLNRSGRGAGVGEGSGDLRPEGREIKVERTASFGKEGGVDAGSVERAVAGGDRSAIEDVAVG